MTLATDPPLAIFLMGPTASGKTALAIEMHKRLPCEIISVDSALIYRDMNIGTAKPSAAELQQAPHALIDICAPTEAYSASRFRADALAEMAKISARGEVPLLVGGTMLYFHALEYGLSDLPAADPMVRAAVLADAKSLGWRAMHERLAAIDPVAAVRIHPNDSQRISRALEVYQLTGKSLSDMQSTKSGDFPYRLIKLIWAPYSRDALRERIAQRFMQMLEAGFAEEVKNLVQHYSLTEDMPSMRSVGYRQMLEYLNGSISRQQLIDLAVTATRQLAKRQMTWLRKETDAVWCHTEETLWEQLRLQAVPHRLL
jgi:tRNA dimethylallyltransferase